MVSSLNERVRLIRERLGKTQAEMAEQLGLKQGSYSAMESTAQSISGSVLRVYYMLFDVNIEYLLEGKGKPFLQENEIWYKENKAANDALKQKEKFTTKDEVELKLLRELSEVLKKSNSNYEKDIEQLKSKNAALEEEIKKLKQAKSKKR